MTEERKTEENTNILEIRCPQCGAPAGYDIIRHLYLCGYCGSQVTVRDANLQVHGFRKIRSEKLRESMKQYHLCRASCTGCGAAVVFEESEALSSCSFCGSSLVRRDYLSSEDMPESVIPFALTEAEARARLEEWCHENRTKAEARHLKKITDRLRGFYLPYEMVRGPVAMDAGRMDIGKEYSCEGFMNCEFINRSKQLDNLLLNGMEPYDLKDLKGFDFGYLAGQRVKISDLDEEVLADRIRQETAVSYTPYVRKVFQTRAVLISADVNSALRLPVLLPAYYVSEGNLCAAVNGQTGKVSVRAEKKSYYYFLPWWLKAILATVLICLVFTAAAFLLGMGLKEAFLIAGMLAVVMIVIMLCLFSDYSGGTFAVEAGHEIFTSGKKTFHRERGGLVMDDEVLESRVEEPVFFYKIKDKMEPVILKFATPWRILRMILTAFAAVFLPVIIALFLNGFDFRRLELGGSAVWFCIMVPVVPVYLLKLGILNLYDKPQIWLLKEDGTRQRYHDYSDVLNRENIKAVLRILFVPPVCFVIWICIAVFCAMCWWTAFGFGI